MRKVLVLAVLLSGCSGSAVPPPPATGNKAGGELIGGTWQFQYSPNMPGNPVKEGGGWHFDFPSRDGVHYLVTGVNGLAPGKKEVTLEYEVSVTGSPVFEFKTAADNTCDTPKGNVSLYMQRRGDDMSGQGAYEFYRFWSRPLLSELKAGVGSLTVPLADDQWISVYGKHGQLAGAVANLQAIGMTFGGGCFAGHGVFATGGTAKFIGKSYRVD